MIDLKELDSMNTYNPNLNDIEESARRTYGEANCFYEKEVFYIKHLLKKLYNGSLKSKELLYDVCHSSASDLAKCCEMYLKAIYIYENRNSNKTIDEIWEELKTPEFKKDKNGKLLYKTQLGIITYPLYDINGNIMLDSKGNEIYTDDNNNLYSPNNRGSKIKMNGHDLERLIYLLSNETQELLKTRMCFIPISKTNTKNNKEITMLDFLINNKHITLKEEQSQSDYTNGVIEHKNAFEDARYSGQNNTNVSIMFIYHLASQIKVVSDYIFEQNNKKVFNITNEELKNLPSEIQLLANYDRKLISFDLIKLIVNDENAKSKLIFLINKDYIKLLNKIKPNDFYNLISKFELDEILKIIDLCSIKPNYLQYYIIHKLTIHQMIDVCIYIKTKYNIMVNSEVFDKILLMIISKISFKGNIDKKFEKFEKNNEEHIKQLLRTK